MTTLATHPVLEYLAQKFGFRRKPKPSRILEYLDYKRSMHDEMGSAMASILGGIISKMQQAALKHSSDKSVAHNTLHDALYDMHLKGTPITSAPNGVDIAVKRLFDEIGYAGSLTDNLREILGQAYSGGIKFEHVGDVLLSEAGDAYRGWRFTFTLEQLHKDMERQLGPCWPLQVEVTDGDIPDLLRNISIENLAALDTADAEKAKVCFDRYWTNVKDQLTRDFG